MKKNLITLILCCQVMVSLAQWNPNPAENLQISGLPTADMQTMSTKDGKLWVAFYHQNGNNYDMRAQLFDTMGNKMLGDNGVLVSNKTSGTATFVFNVCVDDSNNLIIGCQDERAGNIQAVLYKISQTGTHLWNENGIILGEGLAPYPVVATNQEVIVTWDESIDNTLKLQKISTNGSLAWATPKSILVNSKETTRGQIVANLNNKFTMVYQKTGYGPYTTLYAQQFDSSGTALYNPLQICDQTTAGYNYYSINVEADTTYFGYFCNNGNRFNSFLQRINPDGTIPWGINGSNFNINTNSGDNFQGPTEICHLSNSPYIWATSNFCDPNQTNYGVYVQKFLKTNGNRLLSDSGKEVYPVSSNRDIQAGNLLIVDDGPMFITYDANYKIYATKLDSKGDFVWPENKVVLSSTSGSISNSKGRFGFNNIGQNIYAATWVENRGTDDLGYIQAVSNNGALLIHAPVIKNMKVYPIPTKNYLNVSNLKGSDIIIYNNFGQICFRVDKLNTDNIDLSTLENGVYILTSKNQYQTNSMKIIISK